MSIKRGEKLDYRQDELNVGDRATTEAYQFSGSVQDIDGKLVKVNGICQVWGTVTAKYDYHCTVLCDQLRFPQCGIIAPIKEENRYNSSANFVGVL